MANYPKLLEMKKVHLNDLTVLFDTISKALCTHNAGRLQILGFIYKKTCIYIYWGVLEN